MDSCEWTGTHQLAKMSKYLGVPVLPDVFFVVFLVSWFITRQVLLLQIIWNVTIKFNFNGMTPSWNPNNGLIISRPATLAITISLWILYALLCAWFWLGCKVAYNVVRGQAAEDSRSDDENEEYVLSYFQLRYCALTKTPNRDLPRKEE